MFKSLSTSLVTRFNTYLLAGVTLALLGFAVLAGWSNYNRTIEVLKFKANEIIELAKISLEVPLWNYDEETIQKVAQAILFDPDVVALRILDGSGEVVLSKRVPSLGDEEFENLVYLPSYFLSHIKIERGEGEEKTLLGQVQILSTKAKAEASIRQSSQMIAGFTLALILLIGLMVNLMARRFIKQPIRQLEQSANALALGDLEQEIDCSRKDELGSLAQSFAEMRDSIRRKLDDLEVLNRTGEQLATSLEQQTTLDCILATLGNKLSAERGALYLLDDRYQLACRAQFPEGFAPPAVADLHGSLAGLAFREQRILHHRPEQSKGADGVAEEGMNLLCIPLLDGHNPFGVIEVHLPPLVSQLDEGDHHFARTIARMGVNAIKNNRFLALIEEQNRTLEQKVRQRTAAIKDLMDNTGQGFLSFGPDCLVHPTYSRACEVFFGQSLAGQPALELLFGAKAGEAKEVLDLLFAGTAGFQVLGDMLPKEAHLGKRILDVAYRYIPGQEQQEEDKVMVILTDVTQERALAAQLKADEEKNQMIIRIAVDKEGFLKFVRELEHLFGQIQETLGKPLGQINANELFRYYHTIKGGNASYGLRKVAEEAHRIEDQLNQVRSGAHLFTQEFVASLRQETEGLREKFLQSLADLSDLISQDEIKEGSRRMYKVPAEKLEEVERLLERVQDPQVEPLRQMLVKLRKQPIAPVLKKFAQDAVTLAERLNKQIEVKLLGQEMEVLHDQLEHLFGSLVHLIRNSVDHGIETPDVRQMLGKPEVGRLTIGVEEQDGAFLMTIQDDGGGIDPDRIRQVAQAKGLINEAQAQALSDEEAVKLIFAPGFSTKEEVTAVSGRGVGMDAVNAAVEELKGQIQVNSLLDQGTTFKLLVPVG